jgi:hypothetical protein
VLLIRGRSRVHEGSTARVELRLEFLVYHPKLDGANTQGTWGNSEEEEENIVSN